MEIHDDQEIHFRFPSLRISQNYRTAVELWRILQKLRKPDICVVQTSVVLPAETREGITHGIKYTNYDG